MGPMLRPATGRKRSQVVALATNLTASSSDEESGTQELIVGAGTYSMTMQAQRLSAKESWVFGINGASGSDCAQLKKCLCV